MDVIDGPLDADTESDTCHAKGCELPATTTCERCARRFCAAHSSELVLQRREDSSERPARQDMLTRLPTRTETYMLCGPCRAKPILRNLSLPTPPSPLRNRRRQGGD
jgi:hypothetical protein